MGICVAWVTFSDYSRPHGSIFRTRWDFTKKIVDVNYWDKEFLDIQKRFEQIAFQLLSLKLEIECKPVDTDSDFLEFESGFTIQ